MLRFFLLRFFISGPSAHGEGELKLANWINVASACGRKQAPGSASPGLIRALPSHDFVIVGGDADLVVQCLALPHTSNLFVYNPQAITTNRGTRGNYI